MFGGCQQSYHLILQSSLPDKKLIAYRILLIRHKTGFILAEPVFDFIRARLELETVIQLKRLFRAKLGPSMAAAIMEDFDSQCKYASYEAYMADQAP
jgi:hypothetical protein